MYTSTNEGSVVNEEIWHAWVQKGRLRDQAAARRGRMLGGIALVILALGIAFYLFSVRQGTLVLA
jgi:hypothetical protein